MSSLEQTTVADIRSSKNNSGHSDPSAEEEDMSKQSHETFCSQRGHRRQRGLCHRRLNDYAFKIPNASVSLHT